MGGVFYKSIHENIAQRSQSQSHDPLISVIKILMIALNITYLNVFSKVGIENFVIAGVSKSYLVSSVLKDCKVYNQF